MALPNEIQIGRLNSILFKLLDMKEGAPAPQLTGEIVPAIILENDRPEYAFLGGVRLLWGRSFNGPTASELVFSQLRNPPDSDVLITIERVWLASSSSITVNAGYEETLLTQSGNATSKAYRDTRFRPLNATNGTAQLVSGSNTATIITGPNVFRSRITANNTQQIEMPIVLNPGMSVVFEANNLNTELQVSWFWRERYLEQSERR